MITIEQARQRWRGVLAPIATPFREDLTLDLPALEANMQWLLDRGARLGNTIFLAAGSGGDFTSMNLEERKQVIATIAGVVAGRAPVIAGVQTLDVRDCIALCQFCEDLEVDAVQISGPFYYDGRPGDVIAWFGEVARHTSVGFAVYNNWYTGYDMPIALIDELLDLPNSIGVKWSSPRIETFEEGVRRLSPKAAVVNNTFITVLGHMLGCRSFVSHFANYWPEFCWRIWDLMEAGDYGAAQQAFDRVMVPYQKLVGRIAARTAGEGVFVRPAMRAVGLNGGHSRLPSRDEVVTPELEAGFRRLLIDAGCAV
jgi:4-hydroxy-tetrahydrodipicolinate synthase